ncbi:GAF domain-containing protein [Tunicatimonas pelagia]|uniref:GAF domain-containing protein n=1 Tax=Tunicatimonas pelagia TaxID=931531 RepID=UPI002666A7D2|nr:GAF domain-containing protein [Tunicatimonas pelagia]WKN45748.1 GAF domain-containing protein [Tunicatimonas pelagia]
MKFRSFIQEHSVLVAIFFTVALIGASSLFTFYGRYESKRFYTTKEQVETVSKRVDSIYLYMNDMDKSVRGYLVKPADHFLTTHNSAHTGLQRNFEKLRALLEKHQFANADGITEVEKSMNGYYNTLNEILAFKKQGNDASMFNLYGRDQGTEVWNNCRDYTNQVLAFEHSKYEEAKNRYNFYLDIAAILQIVLLLIGIPTLLYAIHQIRNQAAERRNLFNKLAESHRMYLFDNQVHHRKEKDSSLIGHLINDLKTAAGFVKRISQGDYSVTWEGINDSNREANKNNLTGALIQMREKMKAVKQKDQQRLWTTEGTSKIAEITRKHQKDPQTLADELLSYLVKYVDANQGGLFFLQEDKDIVPLLELVGCYAYDKKKHTDKVVKIGQGLVGQTYLEKKTLHLTKIPDQYVAITSGLGESTPNALLIVPLISNEEVLGVLELATFTSFQPYQIAFLEDVGEIIASVVANVRTNIKTKQLLDQSKENTEELQASEEEMRQNMEELQATQEEMQRKTQEYEAVIERQQAKIQELEGEGHTV